MPISNLAQTSPHAADSSLRTRFYTASSADVTQFAQGKSPQTRTYFRRWKLVANTTKNGVATLKFEVPVLLFTDDLTLSISEENGETRVDARSQSRIGKGDFGENARHIRQILQTLDAKFAQ